MQNQENGKSDSSSSLMWNKFWSSLGEEDDDDDEGDEIGDDNEYDYEYDLNGKKRIGREKKLMKNKKKGDGDDDGFTTTVTDVRNATREMERYGGGGRWFHNDY